MRFSVNLTKISKIALLKFSAIIYGNRLKRISKKKEKKKKKGDSNIQPSHSKLELKRIIIKNVKPNLQNAIRKKSLSKTIPV